MSQDIFAGLQAGLILAAILVAFGLALIFSVLAVVSKTPMMVDKVVWNLAIAIVLGITVPVLACG